MPNRKTALATLALLAPFVAEFLLGGQYLAGPPEIGKQLGMYSMYVALYGSGALLIREVARRRGLGWPTILVLALAFGVAEEGLWGLSRCHSGWTPRTSWRRRDSWPARLSWWWR